MKDTKIQWHPAFVAAMGLELKQNRDDLIFEKEYNLNTKPLEIDLLVIKKTASVQIISEIGRLFKGHNIVEYKSPEDHLDIDTFYKTLAYGCLYKAYGKTVDAIKAEDITISILREAKPVELFHYFKEHGCIITHTSHTKIRHTTRNYATLGIWKRFFQFSGSLLIKRDTSSAIWHSDAL